MDVARKIKKYVEAHGVKQSYLSKKTGISEPKLSLALSGKRRMTFDEYEAICWALKVGVDAFLEPKAPTQNKERSSMHCIKQ